MIALRRARRLVRPLALALALTLAPYVAVGPMPTASATVCEAFWGSHAKVRDPYSTKKLVDVRARERLCSDRLVIHINSRGRGRPGFHVRYVDQVAHDGSGEVVPLRGRAQLQVIVHAPAYNRRGLTYQPADRSELVDVTGFRTFRQVAWAGTFEGQTTIGLGVRARLPMRVFVRDKRDGGHKVIVDVAHLWY